MRSQLLVVLAVPLALATRLESFHAGMHAHKAGNLDEALTHFRAAIDADGSLGADDVSLNLVAGELMVQRGLANEAVGCFQHAIELCAEHNLSAKQQAICQYSLALALEEAGGDEARVEALQTRESDKALDCVGDGSFRIAKQTISLVREITPLVTPNLRAKVHYTGWLAPVPPDSAAPLIDDALIKQATSALSR